MAFQKDIQKPSIQFSYSVMSDSLWHYGAVCQASLSITNSQSLLKLMSIESVMSSNHLNLYHPFLLPPSISPSISVFSNESDLRIRWAKYGSFTLAIFTFQRIFSTDFLYNGLVECSERNSQEFYPTSWFKNINSPVLSFLYNLTLTSIHDYWKNHSFDQTDIYWQNSVSAF